MSKKLTYHNSGVSIDKGNELVSSLKEMTKDMKKSGVLSGIGGFAALFDIHQLGYRHPILVSGTDGVGTKLKLAIDSNRHENIGIDLVAMCANDILVQGAQPLFFLDYFSCASLDPVLAKIVIQGIVHGCQLSNCVLMGGETAEMPGLYFGKDYDLAGFCVGVVEKDQLVTGLKINKGDHVLGLASSGAHANGFSLIRRVLSDHQIDVAKEQLSQGLSLLDALMQPTKIYVSTVHSLLSRYTIHGMAHITGGGLLENIPRVLPEGLGVHISRSSWPQNHLFDWLQKVGNIDTQEMFRVFNQGIGYVLIVPANESDQLLQALSIAGEEAYLIGQVEPLSDVANPVRITD